MLCVLATDAEGCWAESNKTCYVERGPLLHLRHGDRTADDGSTLRVAVGTLPAAEVPVQLVTGDELVVTRSTVSGRNAIRDSHGHVLTPATVGCTVDQVFEDVESGDRIWIPEDSTLESSMRMVLISSVAVESRFASARPGTACVSPILPPTRESITQMSTAVRTP